MMNLSFFRIVSISFHLFVSQTLAKRLNEKDNNHIRDIREASAGDTTAKVDARRSESDSMSGSWTKPWTKIVGGVPATAGLYPWFALATYSSTFGYTWGGCGGTLITPEYVLSAAHCFASEDASQNAGDGFEVGTLCQNDFSNCDQSYEHSSIDQIYLHPGYDPETSQNDIALIKLQTKITGIEPAKIDLGTVANDYEISKRNLWAIGFGDQDPDLDVVQVPDKLHHVELSYVDQLQCQNQYNVFNDIIETYYPGDFPDLMISDDMICASDPGQDSCQGDSGGPLYDMDNDVLVGIVSWGVGCGEPILGVSVPGVYSKVSHFTQWIQSTICEDGGHSDPQPELCMTTTLPPTPAPTSSPVTSFPQNIIPVSYDYWYGFKQFPAPSEYGVIEYNPVGHDYEGIAMRLTKDNRVTGSHLWVDMMLPINPAMTKKPRAISFQFKMKDLRPNGMYCSMFLKRVGAPSSQASHLEIKFDKNVFRMYSSALQRDTSKGPISSVKADTWIDLVVEFDWEDCKIHIPAPFDVTDDMGSTGGACDYDGIEAVLLRGYSFDPNTEYLQAWRKIELLTLTDLMPEDPAPAPTSSPVTYPPPTPAPTSFPQSIIPVSYDNWYGPKQFPAPSEYGVIEYNPVGHDYEGIAMRLTKDNRVTGSHLWVDMMLPINPAMTKKPRAISFQFKMKDLRPNGMYCSMFLKRVGAPSSQASHLEIKFDKNVFRMYSSALQRDTSKGPISSVKADTWIDLVVEFDWENCKIHIPAPFDVTDDMGSTGGACDYDGVEAVLLRGYSFDPNTEYLQAWRKIELLANLMPEDPAPAPTISDFNLAPTSITSSSRSSGKHHNVPNILILAFSAALSLMIL